MDVESIRTQLSRPLAGPDAKTIAFVAMEGWSQKGGQGDYVRELAKALAERGQRVLVVNPYYAHPYADIADLDGHWLFDVQVPVGGGAMAFGVFHNQVGAVHYLRFRDTRGLLFPEVYPATKVAGIAYPDSLYGYVEAIVLSRVGFHILAELGTAADVLHFNDWQSALGPIYLRGVYRQHPRFRKLLTATASVIVVHNLAYQGVFPGAWETALDDPLVRDLQQTWVVPSGEAYYTEQSVVLDLFSLTRLPARLQLRDRGGLEFWSNLTPGQHNLLKGGLQAADRIVAVSKGNAAEIGTDHMGFGLGGIIAERAAAGALAYVYNGLDTAAYGPAQLEELHEMVAPEWGLGFTPFAADSPNLLSLRARNKAALKTKLNRLIAAEAGLDRGRRVAFGHLRDDGPEDLLLVSVTRLVRQKGFDLLLLPLEPYQELGVQAGDRLIDVLLRLRGPHGAKLQLLLLGTAGDDAGEAFVTRFRDLAEQRAEQGRIAAMFSFDRHLANQIRCSGDLFFMPSQYEPGGVANIQAAVAGALCVLTRTGGLVDFVEAGGTHPAFTAPPFDYDRPGTLQETARGLVRALASALHLHALNREEWEHRVRAAMRFNGDWASRVDDYLAIYSAARSGISG
jgi:starch synthase